MKEDDVLLGTVKKIEGTTVFVKLDNGQDGSMTLSEIAAGRIRNLREYVVPNKRIAVKILKISPHNIQLSLRRVTGHERESVLNEFKKEQTLITILKTVTKNAPDIVQKIKEKQSISEFLERLKETSTPLESYVSATDAQTIFKIISEKKEKEKFAQRTILVKSNAPDGLEEIQKILSLEEGAVHYLGGSKFTIQTKGKDYKDANQKLLLLLELVEKRAKERKAAIEIKEK